VLATKPEVVAGICKRLLASDGLASSDDAEVAIYFADIQGETKMDWSAQRMSWSWPGVDHILKLQQSLMHYERMLSESHPMYLQNLRMDLLRARETSEYAAFVLGIVAVAVLPPTVLTGMCTLYAYLFASQLLNDL
jgi:magnesium transporter